MNTLINIFLATIHLLVIYLFTNSALIKVVSINEYRAYNDLTYIYSVIV